MDPNITYRHKTVIFFEFSMKKSISRPNLSKLPAPSIPASRPLYPRFPTPPPPIPHPPPPIPHPPLPYHRPPCPPPQYCTERSWYMRKRMDHWCSVVSEKSQPSGPPFQWETRQASFPTGTVGPRVGIFLSPLNTNDGFYLSHTPGTCRTSPRER